MMVYEPDGRKQGGTFGSGGAAGKGGTIGKCRAIERSEGARRAPLAPHRRLRLAPLITAVVSSASPNPVFQGVDSMKRAAFLLLAFAALAPAAERSDEWVSKRVREIRASDVQAWRKIPWAADLPAAAAAA